MSAEETQDPETVEPPETMLEALGMIATSSLAYSVITSTAVLAFGVALGVKWAAVDTINQIGATTEAGFANPVVLELAPIYNHHMKAGLAVAFVGLMAAVAIDWRARQ